MLTFALTAALCLVFGYVFFVLTLRCAGVAALPLGRGRRLALERCCASGERFTRTMGVKSVIWAAALLAACYGASVIYCAAGGEASWQAFCRAWRHWDAPHYLDLAEKGYSLAAEDGRHLFLVFFPLYPWLVRLLHMLIPSWELCGHLVSAVCFIAGSWVFARLVTEEYGWATARLSLLLLSAWPYAFFFGATYTESLFFFLSAAAFACIRKHRWLAAGLVGALAALTRMQGLLLIPVGLAEYALTERPVQRLRARDWRGLGRGAARALLPLMLALAGTGIYLWLNYAVEGDPFRFMTYQKEHWSNGFAPMPLCLKTILLRITTARIQVRFTTWLPELAVFLVCLPPTVWAARHMDAPWAVYLALSMALNYSISWPLSCGRYMACAFPLFVTAARMLRRRPGLTQAALTLSALAMGTMLFIYLSGGHVY